MAKRLPEWLPAIQDHLRYKLEDIAVDTFRAIGLLDKAKAILVEKLLSQPSKISLSAVVEFTDEEELSQLKDRINDSILLNKELQLSHLTYLQETNQYLLANEYLLTRHEQLDGEYYNQLIPAAKTFEAIGFPLAASLIWRILTGSVLARSYNKAYPYAAKYLKSLHALAPDISAWQDSPDHISYLKELHQAHARKLSFWKLIPQEILQQMKQ